MLGTQNVRKTRKTLKLFIKEETITSLSKVHFFFFCFLQSEIKSFIANKTIRSTSPDSHTFVCIWPAKAGVFFFFWSVTCPSYLWCHMQAKLNSYLKSMNIKTTCLHWCFRSDFIGYDKRKENLLLWPSHFPESFNLPLRVFPKCVQDFLWRALLRQLIHRCAPVPTEFEAGTSKISISRETDTWVDRQQWLHGSLNWFKLTYVHTGSNITSELQ